MRKSNVKTYVVITLIWTHRLFCEQQFYGAYNLDLELELSVLYALILSPHFCNQTILNIFLKEITSARFLLLTRDYCLV